MGRVETLAMKQTCIICDKCRSRIYGVGYSTTWSKARRHEITPNSVDCQGCPELRYRSHNHD